MNRLHMAFFVAFVSAIAFLFTTNPLFFVTLIVSSVASGWVGMEQRFGNTEVN